MEVVLRRVVPRAVHLEIRRDHAEGELLDGRADRDAGRAGLGSPEGLLERLRGDLVDVRPDHRAPFVTKRVIDPLQHPGLHGGVSRVALPGEGHGALRGAEASRVPSLLSARDEVGDEAKGDDKVQPLLGQVPQFPQTIRQGEILGDCLPHALEREAQVRHRALRLSAFNQSARANTHGRVIVRASSALRASREWDGTPPIRRQILAITAWLFSRAKITPRF